MILLKPKPYDYLIVGAGVFGSVCAYELNKSGKKCLVIDKRSVIGGNCYTENVDGIHVHKYGAIELDALLPEIGRAETAS